MPKAVLDLIWSKRFAPEKERRNFGRERRLVVPRNDQGYWEPETERRNPVRTLFALNANRDQNLLPLKWERMDRSPFSFFRGAAALMAADLARLPITGLAVQMCGDAHVQNLGAYAAPDGHLVFDLNDFDETLPGPWEWDVKRLATSITLAGREAGHSKSECVSAVLTFVRSYRRALERFSGLKVLDLAKWEVRRHTRRGPVQSVLQNAEHATSEALLRKLTVGTSGPSRRFHDRPPVLAHVPKNTAAAVLSSLNSYRETLGADRQQVLDAYRPVDVAFKVVGTGSVGTRDYIVLLLSSRSDDPLFLQVKEELPSCYAPHLREVSSPPHQGRRVAEGQHRIQTVTDPFVGWTTIGSREFLVRQLADHKATIDPMGLKGAALGEYAEVCGEVLAKAHARTGDAAAIAGYCGRSAKLDKAISKFAAGYAEQTERDYDAFHKAVSAHSTRGLKRTRTGPRA